MNPPTPESGKGSHALLWVGLIVAAAVVFGIYGTGTKVSYRDRDRDNLPESSSKDVVAVTLDNWDREVVQSDVPVVVDFWAPWCGPCMRFAPTFDKLASSYSGRVKFCKLNVDDAQKVVQQFGVESIPHVLIFKGGALAATHDGGKLSEAALASTIDKMLKKS
jgi:thioredoxin 1